MKRIFLTLLMLLVFVPSALASSKLSCRIAEDDTVVVTGCWGEDAEVVIPSIFRGRAVTAIDSYAFKDNVYLERVTIPDCVTSIGESAFNSCVNLREVVFDGWEDAQIGEYAFYNCPLLELDLPEFSYYVAEDGTAVITGRNTHDAYLEIPSQVDGIPVSAVADEAFAGDEDLQSVFLPAGVTLLGQHVFSDCPNLTDIETESVAPFSAAPGKETVFTVSVSGYCADDNSVGMDWYFLAAVDGIDISEQNRFALCEGKEICIDVTAVEDEKKPDYGYGSTMHRVTRNDLAEGFSETIPVTVEEDAGRYKGNRCQVDVTVTFRPKG